MKSNPTDDKYFRKLVKRITTRLGVISDSEAQRMTQETVDLIEQEWAAILGERWAILEEGLVHLYENPKQKMIDVQERYLKTTLLDYMRKVVGVTSMMVGIRGLLSKSFRFPYRRTATNLTRHHGFYVRNQYGRISPVLSRRVRTIIERGLKNNRTIQQITRDIKTETRDGLKMKNYWRIVSSNAVARSRNYSMVKTFQNAGYNYYKWTSVIDKRTTPQCVFMHDKLIPIGPAIQNTERSLEDDNPETTYSHTPFIDYDGNEISVTQRNGKRNILARRSNNGRMISMLSSNIVGRGVTLPPAHMLCRSSVSAVQI
jgi:SPP1 gp7 family putative phage head morphogenesis protein